MKKTSFIGFADFSVERRKIKSEFFNQVNTILDWRPIEKIIDKHYTKGLSATGASSYPGLLLFKMSLLQVWYNLSDYEVEDQVNDRISFSKFVGLSIDDKSPDHSVLSRFRTEMTRKGAYQKLHKEIVRQLEKHSIIIKSGGFVDASITDSPRKPKGRAEFEVAQDREEQPRNEDDITKEENSAKLIRKQQPCVDSEGRWVKKGNQLRYGYKKHVVTDPEGLVLGVLTTPANVNEMSNLEEVLDTCTLPANIPLAMDKGYQSDKNRKLLKNRKLKPCIMHKATRGKRLTELEKKYNKAISRFRYKVERTFAGMKRWFGSGTARYVGIAKTHTQHLIEAMCYNLYRSPGIIASNRVKC